MGWKTLKDTMEIGHNVEVKSDKIIIGSGYVSELAAIDTRTGAIIPSEISPDFLRVHYPAIANASQAELLALIQAEDTFSNSLTVYSYQGSKILESQCSELGYPNNTHAGEMMFDNSHSPDKAKVVEWAKSNARLHVQGYERAIERLEAEMAGFQRELAKGKQWIEELDAHYPASNQE